MTFAICSSPTSQATARLQRLFKTRRNGGAWTMAVRAIRVGVAAGREVAPWQSASGELLAAALAFPDGSMTASGFLRRLGLDVGEFVPEQLLDYNGADGRSRAGSQRPRPRPAKPRL